MDLFAFLVRENSQHNKRPGPNVDLLCNAIVPAIWHSSAYFLIGNLGALGAQRGCGSWACLLSSIHLADHGTEQRRGRLSTRIVWDRASSRFHKRVAIEQGSHGSRSSRCMPVAVEAVVALVAFPWQVKVDSEVVMFVVKPVCTPTVTADYKANNSYQIIMRGIEPFQLWKADSIRQIYPSTFRLRPADFSSSQFFQARSNVEHIPQAYSIAQALYRVDCKIALGIKPITCTYPTVIARKTKETGATAAALQDKEGAKVNEMKLQLCNRTMLNGMEAFTARGWILKGT